MLYRLYGSYIRPDFSTSDFKLEKQYNLKIEYIARPKSESHRCFVCCNFTQKLCESVHRLRLYIPALVHKTKTLKHHHFFLKKKIVK